MLSFDISGGTAADVVAVARHLHRAGQWDAALALLGDHSPELRAEILVDRYWWRLDDPTGAATAVATLDPATPAAGLLRGLMAYTRHISKHDPLPDDATTAEQGFRAAAQDEPLGGWAAFWLGVLADNIHGDRPTAKRHYD